MTDSDNSGLRNPFYMLLLVASLFFVVTAMAYAVVPMLERRAHDAGEVTTTSPIRDSLREHGWIWLIVELALMIVFGLASMLLDRHRLRRLQTKEEKGTIPSSPKADSQGSDQTVPHDPPTANREAPQGD